MGIESELLGQYSTPVGAGLIAGGAGLAALSFGPASMTAGVPFFSGMNSTMTLMGGVAMAGLGAALMTSDTGGQPKGGGIQRGSAAGRPQSPQIPAGKR